MSVLVHNGNTWARVAPVDPGCNEFGPFGRSSFKRHERKVGRRQLQRETSEHQYEVYRIIGWCTHDLPVWISGFTLLWNQHQDSWAYNWINTESSFHRALFPHCKHDWAKKGHANDLVRLFSPTRKYCFLVEWLMPLNTSCSYFISVCLRTSTWKCKKMSLYSSPGYVVKLYSKSVIKTCNCVKRSRSHQSFVHFLITCYFLCWLHSSCPNTSFCSL